MGLGPLVKTQLSCEGATVFIAPFTSIPELVYTATQPPVVYQVPESIHFTSPPNCPVTYALVDVQPQVKPEIVNSLLFDPTMRML